MAATVVQSAEGTSTLATVTAAFASPPADGNLIVLCFASDDYNGSPNAGWTQSAGMEQQTFHGSYLWWRVASGGSNSFQYTIGSATNSSWILLEISGLDVSPYDISAGRSQSGSGGPFTTPAIVPSAGERFLVASVGGSHANTNLSGDYTSWSNSFTAVRTSGPATGTGTRDIVGVATRAVTGNGVASFSTAATMPMPVESSSGLIISFKVAAAGGNSYTLDAVGGAITTTGSAAALKRSARLSAEAGSSVVAGQSATLRRGPKLPAEAGSVAVSGQAAGLLRSYRAAALPGSIAIEGQGASLKRGYRLSTEVGALTIVGTAAGFTKGQRIAAESGAIAVTGLPASFIRSYRMAAEAASILVTGSAASLVYTAEHVTTMPAEGGSINVTGSDATLRRNAVCQAASGTINIDGQSARVARGYRIGVQPGSIEINGVATQFALKRRLLAASGAILIVGKDANLVTILASPTADERVAQTLEESRIALAAAENRLAAVGAENRLVEAI